MSSFIFSNQKISKSVIGGKGSNLHKLNSAVTVPNWFALPVELFTSFLETTGISKQIDEILQRMFEATGAEMSEQIGTLICSTPFPEDLRDEIIETVRDTFDGAVSVRSSAADEDGASHSFAGMHESFLWVSGDDEIISAVQKVWASAYSERAILYRIKNGLSVHPVPMAVIIQEMVDAYSSGVVFTADPTTGDPHKIVISSLFGLGEGLVSAGLESDHFHYDKESSELNETCAMKNARIVCGEAGGVSEQPLPDELKLVPSLTEEQLDEIVNASREIEALFRRPQDIEFSFDREGKLYILQSRDITTVAEYGPAAGNRQVWDNSNIIESYSGVTSPMTFSFIRNAYAVVYTCFSEVMGIPSKVIEQNQIVYRNMLGLFSGQVYYNLINWYRLVKQFPGYNYNKEFMESMMGVKFRDETPDEEKRSSFLRRWFIELPKLLRLLGSLISKFVSLKRTVPRFNTHFDTYYSRWEAMDFSQKAPFELMAVYREMEEKLLKNWKVPIINDFYVMVFYGVLKKLTVSWCGDKNGALQNNLICGEGDIASTEPTKILMTLARKVKADAELEKLFLTKTAEELYSLVQSSDSLTEIKEGVDHYLNLYGFRCMNELKLEEPSLHETPEFIYQMLSNYVAMSDDALNPDLLSEREQKIRRSAEQEAFSKIPFYKRPLFKLVLKHARTGVKNRENMRFARTKIYGTLRILINAVAADFHRESLIDAPEDIYYLTIDEMWDFIGGTAVTTNLRELIRIRRDEFDRYRDMPEQDEHFETYGNAYVKNLFKNRIKKEVTESEDGSIRGVPCSPGVVKGVARVIKSPRDDVRLNGEILVASRTDPGWVPLYPSVSGIVIERGSILSHSAIVAREMGIPAIVGVPELLNRIKDGDLIEIDGGSGTVRIV